MNKRKRKHTVIGESPKVSRPLGECSLYSVIHRQCKTDANVHRLATRVIVGYKGLYGFPVHPHTGTASDYDNPASGYRNSGDGTVNNVGSNGYYWSATPNNATNGRNLNFNSSNVNPSNNNNRANGFPVRCLKEYRTRKPLSL